MTVEELIVELRKQDPNADVFVEDTIVDGQIAPLRAISRHWEYVNVKAVVLEQ